MSTLLTSNPETGRFVDPDTLPNLCIARIVTHNRKNGSYNVEVIGSIDMAGSAHMEDCVDALRAKFPRANSFQIHHPCFGRPWACGSI